MVYNFMFIRENLRPQLTFDHVGETFRQTILVDSHL